MRVFYDSNILVYLICNDSNEKKKVVKNLINPQHFISTQVVSENVNVCLRKLKLSKEMSFNHGRNLLRNFNIITIDRSNIEKSFDISAQFNLSYWDSLIVASAIKANCDILYSEDCSIISK